MAGEYALDTRPSIICRKVASRVQALVAKFEALTQPARSEMSVEVITASPPSRRSLSSMVSYGPGSKSTLRKFKQSIRKRASWFLERSEKENDPRPPARKTPPPKRILRESRSIEIRKRHRHYDPVPSAAIVEKIQRRVSAPVCVRAGLSRLSGSSGTGYDGPVSTSESLDICSEYHYSGSSSSTSTLSTPPVARVLPSSFFAQLLSSNPSTPERQTPPPRVIFNPEETDFLDDNPDTTPITSFSRREKKARIRSHQWNWHVHANGGTHSLWKRRVTPPKISVRALVSRFRQVQPVSPSPSPPPDVAVQSHQKPIPAARKPVKKKDAKYPSEVIHLLDSPASSVTQVRYSADENEEVASIKPSRRHGSSTTASTSNFSSITVRIHPSTVGSKDTPEKFEKYYTAPRMASPQTKKYRKTPPPAGFFDQGDDSTDGSFYTDSSGRNSSSGFSDNQRCYGNVRKVHEMITVSIAVPITTPHPINAVKTTAIRQLVFRYL